MSQSDHCRYKRISAELNNRKMSAAVLSCGDFTNFAKYSVHNNVSNTAISYNRLLPSGKKDIFEIETATANCPTFSLFNCRVDA